MAGQKPRVAFFDFACCEGCQLTILQMEEKILDILGHVDIVEFREAMSEHSDEYDVAFVEGSITREQDIARLKGIRERAKAVVALGACAATGGVNCMKNAYSMDDALRIVYGDDARRFDTIPARPVEAVVQVDYTVHGCPINPDEFQKVFHCILQGRPYFPPDYPVCVECKLKENACLYEKGLGCMGPVTRAGCGAICTSNGYLCFACRGLISEPNRNAMGDLLKKHHLTADQVAGRFDIYTKAGYPREEAAV
jgi:coenzyme F420-reducing hydrogenase gamma subunit